MICIATQRRVWPDASMNIDARMHWLSVLAGARLPDPGPSTNRKVACGSRCGYAGRPPGRAAPAASTPPIVEHIAPLPHPVPIEAPRALLAPLQPHALGFSARLLGHAPASCLASLHDYATSPPWWEPLLSLTTSQRVPCRAEPGTWMAPKIPGRHTPLCVAHPSNHRGWSRAHNTIVGHTSQSNERFRHLPHT